MHLKEAFPTQQGLDLVFMRVSGTDVLNWVIAKHSFSGTLSPK